MWSKQPDILDFMTKTYKDPREVCREHRFRDYTKDQLYSILNLAIHQKKKVHFMTKKWVILNWLSWHIPLEVDTEKDTVIVKWWTRQGHVLEKSMRNIIAVFLSSKDSESCSIALQTYTLNKKLFEQWDMSKESIHKTLFDIQKEWLQCRYIKKWTNNIAYRTQPKTIINLSDTELTYGNKKNNRFMFRTIRLDKIWHIEKIYKKSELEVIKRYNEINSL